MGNKLIKCIKLQLRLMISRQVLGFQNPFVTSRHPWVYFPTNIFYIVIVNEM